MTDYSNLLLITELAGTQEDRSVTVNEAIAKLESGAGMFTAEDVGLNTPPGSPSEGHIYVVGAAPTGAWAAQAENIALYYNGSWRFMPARPGLIAYAENEDVYYRYKTGYGWETLIGGGTAVGTTQTDFLSAMIENPTDKTYTLALKLPFGITILETTTICVSGTCTATFKINTTALGGSANAVSSSEQSQAHASANVAAAGDDIKVTIAQDSPAAADVALMVKYTYELSA